MLQRTAASSQHSAAVRRLRTLSVITVAAFLVLIGQLWYLQVLEGSRLGDLADRNRARVRPLAAARGIVSDRNGVPLVDVRPTFAVSVVPREVEDRQTVLARLSILLKLPYAELDRALDAAPPDSPWPVRVRRGLTFEEVIPLDERRAELPGVAVEVEPRRAYPAGRLAAHLLGYVREASPEQLREGRYRLGDLAGQSGIERTLDEFLRGRDGGEEVEVDAAGRPLRVLERRAPQPGADVTTTLDRRVQEAAERALGDAAGAVVVMDPRNGDLLALASTPAFDPARFSGPIPRDEWLRLMRDPQYPLLNRGLQAYAPGSVFKLVVAAAALQEGLITPSDKLPCPASMRIGNRSLRNWKREDQGPIDLERAIATSCNTFFARLGLTVGIERIARYARAFGFGQPTGIVLGDERAGLVPTPARGSVTRTWSPGDTANVAIGQGRVLVTPLQVARFMAAIANGGILWRPRLIQHVGDARETVLSVLPEATGHVTLAPAVLAVLRRSLRAAVNNGGTASAAHVPGLEVAGKTGTAQIVRDSDPTRGQDHAWFAGYAPAEDPQVVVVVLVERGGIGGRVAAPVAQRVFLEILRSAPSRAAQKAA
jgi:penicillin-binding protein 2